MIKAGDLVIVIKPSHCCNSYGSIGLIFKTANLKRSKFGICECGAIDFNDNRYIGLVGGGFILKSRLKKIDPLSELDDIRTDESISA